MKIMVTGGAGLIGLQVCRQLAGHGHETVLFDLGEQILRVRDSIPEDIDVQYGSILDKSSLRQAMENTDAVLHLAAILGVRRSELGRLRCLEVNIQGTQNVLECAVQAGVKRVVFASSSEVYGEPISNPVTEETMTQGKSVYAVTKMAGEELCRAYHQTYGLPYTILRFFNCYGPYQNAQFVIARFVQKVLRGEPPVIYGDGKQIRSYTYVADVARAVILAATTDQAAGEILNIGNSKWRLSLNELAELVIEAAGQAGRMEPTRLGDFVGADREPEREVHERYGDCSKAQRLLGWEAEVDVVEGVKRMIEDGIIFDGWMNLNDEGT